MILITWNVQWCRGIDGRVEPERIAQTARAMADFDVLCLQELAVGFGTLPGSAGEDQLARLAAALPGYTALFVAGVDSDDGRGQRRQFGNAIFTRLPALHVFRHLLPWPADSAAPSMQRAALEAVLRPHSMEPLRVVCTHLEYYSGAQRLAQVEALRALHAEACGHAAAPSRPAQERGAPFTLVERPASAVLCGDLNFRPDDPEHGALTRAFAEPLIPRLRDSWQVANPGVDHAITFGLHDPDLAEAYCCDYAFVTEDLVARVSRVEVQEATQASDHQPVVVEFQEGAKIRRQT